MNGYYSQNSDRWTTLRETLAESFVLDAETYTTVSLSTAALWNRDPQAKVHGSSSGISSSITSSVLKKQNELILAEWQADTRVLQGMGAVTFSWCCMAQGEFNFPPGSQNTTLHCTEEPYLISRTLKATELKKKWKTLRAFKLFGMLLLTKCRIFWRKSLFYFAEVHLVALVNQCHV